MSRHNEVSYDEVSREEHQGRMARVLAFACPVCKARIGKTCNLGGSSGNQHPQHAARWQKVYPLPKRTRTRKEVTNEVA